MKVDEFARLPFLSAEDIKDGDIITFTDEGRITDSRAGNRIWIVHVELDGSIIPYTPFGDAVAALKKAWGDPDNNYSLDSKKLIGKSAKLNVREYIDNQGQDRKAIVLIPLVDVEDKVIKSETSDSETKPDIDPDDIPVIETEDEEPKKKIDPKDIPF